MTINPPEHDRPIWRFTVTNLTRGWTLTTFDGEVPDLDAGPILLDSADLSWSTESDQLPANMAPSTASFVIGARSLAQLPTAEPTDRLRVSLTRPGVEALHVNGRFGGDMETWNRVSPANVDSIPSTDYMTIWPSVAAVAGDEALAQSDRFPVHPGESVEVATDACASFSYRVGQLVRFTVHYYDATGTHLAGWSYTNRTIPTTVNYQRYTHRFQGTSAAPAGTSYAYVSVGHEIPTDNNDVLQVRNITVATSSEREYFGFTGSLTDLVVDADPSRKVPAAARVTVVDSLTDANQTEYLGRPGQVWDYWPYGVGQRIENTANVCQLNIAIPRQIFHEHTTPSPSPDWLGPGPQLDPDGQDAYRLVADALRLQPVFVDDVYGNFITDWTTTVLIPSEIPVYGRTQSSGSEYVTFTGSTPDRPYLAARKLLPDNPGRDPAATLATTSPTDPTLTVTFTGTPTPAGQLGNPVVPARAVTVPTQWRKDRRNHITHLGFRGSSSPGDAESRNTLYPVGPMAGSRNVRSVSGSIVLPNLYTYAINSDMDLPAHLAVAYGPWLASGTRYQLPELPIHPEYLDPVDLDNIAALFRPMTVKDHLLFPSLSVVGLDPDVAPHGVSIGGTILAAQFTLSRGRLTIYARPATRYQRRRNAGNRCVTVNDARSITHDGHPITVAEAGRQITPADVRHATL